jgi:hypothetical protein
VRDEVLARFADAVETTAPGDDFTSHVMVALPMMSPAAAAVLGKGVLHLLGKWTAVAASGSGFAGVIGGGMPILSKLRRDLRGAIDERERQELKLAGIVAMTNMVLFSLGIAGLARSWLGIAYTIAFSAIHIAIYLVWVPRVKVRRRRAEVLADPSAAERHLREDRRSQFWATLACAIIGVVVVAAWLRL